jgi:hypothetical protein
MNRVWGREMHSDLENKEMYTDSQLYFEVIHFIVQCALHVLARS